MRCRSCQPLPEEVARAADLLGRRWALAILWAAAEAGAVRFNEFKQTLEGIPPRRVFDTRPPHVEYRLTEAGRRLRYVVEALSAFAASA
jgi:DNA-binding HxlR family transcriptional regulator